VFNSAAGPFELHGREIELTVATAEIETVKMLFDFEIGWTEPRRPLAGKHGAAEMVAAGQRSKPLAFGAEWRDVVAELALRWGKVRPTKKSG
jgi:hypothetical protein